MTITLSVQDQHHQIRASASGASSASLIYEADYQPGDCLLVETSEPGAFIDLSLDASLSTTTLYLAGRRFEFPIPDSAGKEAYPELAFEGKRKRLMARICDPEQVGQPRNLALNPFDHIANATAFPHAVATTQTRGEAAFAARCAIDGEIANHDHGFWPYTSWGINCDPDAMLTVEFGRSVMIEAVELVLRADFPHDAWWNEATLTTSDGYHQQITLSKTDQSQRIPLKPHAIEWLRLEKLIKADDPSPFPALTQIAVWGRDIAD